MIYLAHPANCPAVIFAQVRDQWIKQAQLWKETLVEVPDDAYQMRRVWDSVNSANERVLWVSPYFIPAPSLLLELDQLIKDGQTVVCLRDYLPYWGMGRTIVRWEPRGISRNLIAFQVCSTTEKRNVELPAYSSIDVWEWLEHSARTSICRLRGWQTRRWSIRWILGEGFREPWAIYGEECRGWGRDPRGDAFLYKADEANRQWMEMFRLWGKWLDRKR